MRNLEQYPITGEEKIEAVRAAIKRALANARIGGIAPAALGEVLKDLETRYGILNAPARDG
jgi:hypothetical protein